MVKWSFRSYFMIEYSSPLKEMRFVLDEIVDLEAHFSFLMTRISQQT